MNTSTKQLNSYDNLTGSVHLDELEEPMLISVFTGGSSFLSSNIKVILVDEDKLEPFLLLLEDDFRMEECNDC
jgi:hypothetical protein